MPSFVHLDHRLFYTEFGRGERTTVLLHGLLLSQRMHKPLARALAERGNRVVTLDLLGHGRSDRPPNMWQYSMPMFGEQVVALLDHLDVDQAVIAGTSLGANVTLEAAALAPERLRGMVVEMPVLDGAMIACGVAFLPLLLAMRYGGPLMRAVQLGARAIPRGAAPFLLDVGLDTIRQDPAPSGAVLEGLFFGRIAPHRWQRRTFTQPALVIGHRRDPVHPFSDAGMLADELPNGRLLEASSILELRLAPERLTNEIAAFIDECWQAEAPAPPRAAGRRAATR
ncbi:MAG TPA: alpha/beta hydrolase [Solirubrobacteraceae bacterium]|nr:alpha/beta hydrolase [Solirubrobacteraceae bacterium]